MTLTLVNNMVVSHSVGITTAAPGAGDPYITADHTLYDPSGTHTDTSGGGSAISTNDLVGDAALIQGDYHIGAGSLAIDAAIDIGVAVDVDGDPRPIGPLPDIGADERRRYVYLPLVLRNW